MSLSSLLLGLWFAIYGANGLWDLGISAKFMFFFAFVTGLVILISEYRPIKLP